MIRTMMRAMMMMLIIRAIASTATTTRLMMHFIWTIVCTIYWRNMLTNGAFH